MPDDELEIPDFLRRPPGWRPAPDRRRRRWTREMKFTPPPTKEEEKATLALRRALAKEKAAKQAARFKLLRALPRKKKR